MYYLTIKIQNKYYPVNWEDARVCFTDEESDVIPTIFSEKQRRLVHEEVVYLFKEDEYQWLRL